VRKLIGKVRSLTEQVRNLALRDVYARLVRFLEEQAVEDGGRRIVRERLTQADIAARIGGSREMVSRILSDLSAGGYIRVEAKQIVLLRKLPAHW
jgi:CRP/FNR family cyclic AMP-dependent transcriptional regulator